MASYTVPIDGPNGPGFMTVNANNASEAAINASQGGNVATGAAVEGGHQAHTGAGGTAVAGYPSGGSGQLGGGPTGSSGADQIGASIQKMLDAIASGNKQAFDETVREWNAQFGLDTQKFQDDVRRFNENLAISQAGLTGTYQGQQTQQAQQQAFNQQEALAQLYGQGYANFGAVPQGQQTLAAQQQQYQQQLNLAQLASQLQANPFQQAAVLGQANRILGGQSVAGFQAPNVVQGVGTAGGQNQGGLGYLQQIIDDIKSPTANQTNVDSFLQQTPTPNKVDSTSFLRAAPGTQNLVLQAMQTKYGIDPNDALAQIKNTLPQFTAPTTQGSVRR